MSGCQQDVVVDGIKYCEYRQVAVVERQSVLSMVGSVSLVCLALAMELQLNVILQHPLTADIGAVLCLSNRFISV